MDIGTFLLMLGLSYGMGLLWYELLPGKLPEHTYRVAAYPFLGIFAAHALLPWMFGTSMADPAVGGVHIFTALIGSLVGVIVDWVITQARHPAMVPHLEPGLQPRMAA